MHVAKLTVNHTTGACHMTATNEATTTSTSNATATQERTEAGSLTKEAHAKAKRNAAKQATSKPVKAGKVKATSKASKVAADVDKATKVLAAYGIANDKIRALQLECNVNQVNAAAIIHAACGAKGGKRMVEGKSALNRLSGVLYRKDSGYTILKKQIASGDSSAYCEAEKFGVLYGKDDNTRDSMNLAANIGKLRDVLNGTYGAAVCKALNVPQATVRAHLDKVLSK